ncbi:MAG: PSP1 domain-containing protein [Gemmatimonadaceae bacterium]
MLIEVAFKGNRKEFFLWDGAEPPAVQSPVVVDADRGEDVGHVFAVGDQAAKRAAGTSHGPGVEPVTQRAKRLATVEEISRLGQVRAQDEDARRKAMERVRANSLVMKLSDAEWRWDRRKLTIYFTAERRVDFRNLVRELAAMFRTRIELKQIGVRDEAKRLSGVGRCGREYCSASWLPELRPVNLGVAKDQRLSLNPTQISGACGRLMCCLRYEHEFYVQQRRRFPKEGRWIVTARGEERIVANDIFRERVTLRNGEGETRIVPLGDLRRELAANESSLGIDENAAEEELATETLSEEVLRLQDTAERPAFRFPWEGPPADRGARVLPVAPPNVIAAAPAAAPSGPLPAEAPDAGHARRRRGRRGGRRHPKGRGGGRPPAAPGDAAGSAGSGGGAPNA